MTRALDAQEQKWQRESDARTLAEAETIKKTPGRLKGAKSEAKTMAKRAETDAKSLKKVAKTTKKSAPKKTTPKKTATKKAATKRNTRAKKK